MVQNKKNPPRCPIWLPTRIAVMNVLIPLIDDVQISSGLYLTGKNCASFLIFVKKLYVSFAHFVKLIYKMYARFLSKRETQTKT